MRAPLVTWWQWVRHRTWSFNAQSGRYTPFAEGDFHIPDIWRKQSSEGSINEAEGRRLTEELVNLYRQSYRLYEQALAIGVAREQARLFLPGFAVYYTWICKVDAHNLMHFLRLRMAQEAQHEIRVYADAIYRIFKQVLPWTAEAFERFGY